MKILFVTSILATLALVANSARHHNAPIIAPSLSPPLAPSPSTDCSNIIYDMASCISFLSNGSNDTKPGDDCCSGFESVLNFNPECICEAIKSSAELGIDLNITKAMTLPSACGVSAPPISQCGISPPGTAPGTTPANPPETSPSPAVPPTTIETPAPVVSPSAGTGVLTQAPAPAPSGAHSMSTSFGVFIVMLVASFSYVSM